MYNLEELKIVNLFSHKNTVVKFKQFTTTMIYGVNNDDEGCESNGSGKSGIIEGICIALTGNSFREDITKEEFINDEEKGCFVSLTLTNPTLSRRMTIERNIFRKQTSQNKLFINGEQIPLVNDINQEIEKEIGINRFDLLKYFIIGEDNSKSFLSATDTEKKKIISRFSKIDRLESIISDIDVDFKELRELSEITIEKINIIDSNIELLLTQIENEKQAAIERSKKDDEVFNELINEKQQEYEQYKEERQQKEKEFKILDLKIKKFPDLEEEIKQCKQKKEDFDDELEKQQEIYLNLSKQLSTYENKINHRVECPKCKHDFIVNEKLTVKELTVLIEKNKVKIKETQEGIEKYKGERKLISLKIEEYREKQLEYKSFIQERKHHQNNLQDLTQKIQQAENSISELKQKKLNKKKEVLSNNVLKNLNRDLAIAKEEKQQLNTFFEQEIQPKKQLFEYWLFHFSRKGFGTYLTNKVIKNVEGMINHSLREYNINFSVLINGFTRLKNGEVRDKIDVFVLKDGIKPKKFGRLSSGEKARSNISTILALHKLINLSTDGRGLNFLGIDESFDKGLDFIGQKSSLDILEKSGVTTLLISHSNNDIGARNKLIIEKTNDVSIVKP